MIVDKFAQELKELISKKDEVIRRRIALENSLRKGEQYFASVVRNPNAKAMQDACNRALEIMTEYNKVTEELRDLDIIITANVEAYTADFIARCNTAEHLNDAGDLVRGTEMFLVPFKTNEGMVEVTPDDMWFLKLAKQALKAVNIEIVPKKQD